MISSADSVQKDVVERANPAVEELFSDFSVSTSTPSANVNNNQSKQTVRFSFSSRRLTPFFNCDKVHCE